MAGFELNIREPGKPPRLVALTQTIVVGRSRRADVTVEDQEVGREQFRIGIDRGIVVLEGLGRTNRTMVDGSVLDPGARISLSPGARIMVGKTTFVLQNEESTALAARPQQRAEAAAARAQDKPGPVVAAAAAAPQKPAAAQPPATDQGQNEQTMQWQGALRPVAAAMPSEKPITVALSNTDIVPAGFSRDAIDPHELETRLHDALPRLFVKGDTMKRRIRLLKTRCTVGRGESSDVLLPVESVSEAHAEIIFDGTRFVLRDCGSRNGTFVDGNHLRSTQQPLTRHSLIGAGTLRAIFLCNTKDGGKGERRCEERALRMLVGAGRLTRDEGQQILRIASTDTSQSIAEIVLMETALAPTDWVTAIAGARNKVTLWDRIRGMFGRGSAPKPS
jgi:pSer/pThr/pTyr-binding forkhead associated (FHA) protein